MPLSHFVPASPSHPVSSIDYLHLGFFLNNQKLLFRLLNHLNPRSNFLTLFFF